MAYMECIFEHNDQEVVLSRVINLDINLEEGVVTVLTEKTGDGLMGWKDDEWMLSKDKVKNIKVVIKKIKE